MKRVALTLLMVGLALGAVAQQRIRRPGGADPELTRDWPKLTEPAKSEEEVPARLANYLDSLASRDLFSGTVLLARGAEPVFQRAYGMADHRGRGIANSEETAYNVGSITKVFTRLGLLQLRDAGKLVFDRPLRTYLPDYPSKVGDRITLQQLIDHRSGLGDIFGPELEAARGRLNDLADYVPLFATRPLEFEPGTGQRYSNFGYIVLGLVIERVSGRSYYDYVRDEIFAPAGMVASGWPAEVTRSHAIGYTRGADGVGGRRSNASLMPRRGSSAGGSYATASDLLRFVRALPRLVPRRESQLELLRLPPDAPADAPLAVSWGGGAPGVNATVTVDGEWTLVVLSNYDPPAASEVSANVAKLLGIDRIGAPGGRPGP